MLASRTGRRALAAVERWGALSLVASWLPVVGDPITVAVGVARVHLGLVAVVVPALRAARYAALVWALG